MLHLRGHGFAANVTNDVMKHLVSHAVQHLSHCNILLRKLRRQLHKVRYLRRIIFIGKPIRNLLRILHRQLAIPIPNALKQRLRQNRQLRIRHNLPILILILYLPTRKIRTHHPILQRMLQKILPIPHRTPLNMIQRQMLRLIL